MSTLSCEFAVTQNTPLLSPPFPFLPLPSTLPRKCPQTVLASFTFPNGSRRHVHPRCARAMMKEWLGSSQKGGGTEGWMRWTCHTYVVHIFILSFITFSSLRLLYHVYPCFVFSLFFMLFFCCNFFFVSPLSVYLFVCVCLLAFFSFHLSLPLLPFSLCYPFPPFVPPAPPPPFLPLTSTPPLTPSIALKGRGR